MPDTSMGLVTLWTPDIADWAVWGGEGKKSYCKRWGLGYHQYEEILTLERSPHWSKISALQQNLIRYKWLLWMDADAIIANHDVDPFSLCDESYDIIGTHDENGFNSGVFFLKSSDIAIEFLDRVWSKNFSDPFYEQSSMTLVMDEMPNLKIKIIKKNLLNSYWHDYQYKDFVIHTPGEEMQVKRLITKLVQKNALGLRSRTPS